MLILPTPQTMMLSRRKSLLASAAIDEERTAPVAVQTQQGNSAIIKVAKGSIVLIDMSPEQLEGLVDGAELRLNCQNEAPPASKPGRFMVMVSARMLQVDGLDDDTVASAVAGRPVALKAEGFYLPH